VDESMGYVNHQIYKFLEPVTPEMLPFTVSFSN
jgi:hypothetical protein